MPAPFDDRIADLLDRLVPASDQVSHWQAVVADAESGAAVATTRAVGRRGRRPRLLVVAIAALLVLVVAPLSALAVTEGWWFFRFGNAPKPIGSVVVVGQRTFSGIAWTFTAYRSGTDGLCFAATPDVHGAAQHALTGAMSCDEVSGVPKTAATKPSRPHGVSYLMENGNARFPGVIFGPVIDRAVTVDVHLTGGETLHLPTFAAPSALGASVRFFVTPMPQGIHGNPYVLTPISSLVGLDAHGHVVARLVIPGPRLNSALFHISNRGRLVRLSPALKHAFHLQHRGTLIYLMATRNGESIYRLGGNHVSRGVAHVCWGWGRPVNPATLPANERGVGRLIGVISCGPKTAASFPSPLAPVWDLSIYGATRRDKRVTLMELAGIASDAVKTMNLMDARGHVVERVPVIANVYSLKTVPKGIVGVVPTSFDGQALAWCGRGNVRGSGLYLRAHC